MPSEKVTGIVIRAVDYRDYDRMLTLLTLERGRMTVRGQGLRRTGSKQKSAGALFASGEFLLYERNARFTVQEVSISESYYDLRHKLRAFSHAAFIASVIEAAVQEDEPQPRVFALLSRALAYYCYSEVDTSLITEFTLTKLMELLGFKIKLSACARCGKTSQLDHFSNALGGVVCMDCASRIIGAELLGPDALKLLTSFEITKFKTLDELSPIDGPKLLRLLVAFTQHHLGRHFKAAELLERF